MTKNTTPPAPKMTPVNVANGVVGMVADGVGKAPFDSRAWAADLVITLVEGVMGDMCIPMGPDAQTPEWWIEWRAQSPRIHQILENGGRVEIYSGNRLDRAATIVALILAERGLRVDDALARLRELGAVPSPAQADDLYLNAPAQRMGADVIRASLLGGAIGDAMGAEIEFWRLDEIRRRFYGDNITPIPHDKLLGAITDDTQMTLFTAEGMIRAHQRGRMRGICHVPSVVHHALLRWYVTQGEAPSKDVETNAGLVTDPRLHARRAPGLTCLSALGETTGFGDPAQNNSKGCGTIIRMAPVAFSGVSSPRDTAIECSALTHDHPTAGTAAAAFVEILIHLRNGMSIEHAARAAHANNPTGETANAIECALRAVPDGRPETVESLGGGWVAEEALAIAIYAARTARDFASGINIAICHSGDSDSTGSIAGNMLGLMFPHQVWRHPLAEKIQCADRIAWLAQDMAVVTIPHARVPDDFAERYPCI